MTIGEMLMKKLMKWGIIPFIVYAIMLYVYLWYIADSSLPQELIGTRADPHTFMTEKEIMLANEYSKIRNFFYFLSYPYEWFVYGAILFLGFSKTFQQWAEKITRFRILQAGIFIFWFSFWTTLAILPLKLFRYYFARQYQISIQPLPDWIQDQLISFWEGLVLLWIVIIVVYFLMSRFQKYWWIITWILFIPFVFFFMYIQPVLIDPLYNDFYPMKDKQLEEKILALASEVDVSADRVWEVNMSEKTNSINAYVTGVGGNSRIVLWDTLLQRLHEEEILFIMAHELGHYVLHHVTLGVTGYIVFSLGVFYLVYRLTKLMLKKWGRQMRIQRMEEFASLPILLLLISVILFAASPVTNYVSRHMEHTADVYAIELTGNQDAAIGAFQEITKAGLSEVNPPTLIKIFRYTHPPMVDRIYFIQNYTEETN